MNTPIRDVLVLGAGSAGLMAALALQCKLPMLKVRIIRSPDIGVIGVGEGTTPLFPQFLFRYLGLDRATFFREAEPTFKLGGRFLNWGPRSHFDYPFEMTYDFQSPGMPRMNAWYSDWDFTHCNLSAALMEHGRAFPRDARGQPALVEHYAFHIENTKFVGYLENATRKAGVPIIDGKVAQVESDARGVAALVLEDGTRLTADLYVDASGFRAELMRGLGVEHRAFDKALFCDRAVIGCWVREDELILPYTTAETMDAGWCWRIEHEHFVNRGYVFSSRFMDDETAREEYLRKNPKVKPDGTRVVKFRSGRQAEVWRGNAVAIGNAAGFVEPLEATALTIAALQLKLLVQTLWHGQLAPSESLIALYNRRATEQWDDTRDFLAMHYKYNTARDTPFWKACREDTDLGEAQGFVDFYEENGPSALGVYSLPSQRAIYGMDGHFAMLAGQQVPWKRMPAHSTTEQLAWEHQSAHYRNVAQNGVGVKEMLNTMRAPTWNWATQQAPSRTTLQL